jgi:hypothetical protein
VDAVSHMCKAIIFTSGIAAGRSVSCPCLVSQGLSEVGTMLQSGVHVQTISLAAGFNHSAKLHAQPSHWLTFSVSHTVLPQEVTSTRPLVVPRRVRVSQVGSWELPPTSAICQTVLKLLDVCYPLQSLTKHRSMTWRAFGHVILPPRQF